MFRFTIRDMLWLTVVVAVGLGWLCDRFYLVNHYKQVSKDNHALVLTITRLGNLWNSIDPNWREKAKQLQEASPDEN